MMIMHRCVLACAELSHYSRFVIVWSFQKEEVAWWKHTLISFVGVSCMQCIQEFPAIYQCAVFCTVVTVQSVATEVSICANSQLPRYWALPFLFGFQLLVTSGLWISLSLSKYLDSDLFERWQNKFKCCKKDNSAWSFMSWKLKCQKYQFLLLSFGTWMNLLEALTNLKETSERSCI